MLQCSLYFASHEGITEQQKIARFMNLLSGRALKWASAVWDQGGSPVTLYQHFTELFRRVFDHATDGKEAGEQINDPVSRRTACV